MSPAPGGRAFVPALLLTLGGLALLPFAANWLVQGAVGLARWMGVSERFIGLSATAVGTSVPEIATAVLAMARGHAAVAAGTVFGSNVFNLCFALAPAAMIAPLEFRADEQRNIQFDLASTLVLTVFVAVVVTKTGRVGRRTALAMLALYALAITVSYVGGRTG